MERAELNPNARDAGRYSDINEIQPIDSGEHSRRAHTVPLTFWSRNQILGFRTSNPQRQNIESSATEHRILRVRTSNPRSQNIKSSESEHQILRARTSNPQSQNIKSSESEHQILRVRTSNPHSRNIKATRQREPIQFSTSHSETSPNYITQ